MMRRSGRKNGRGGKQAQGYEGIPQGDMRLVADVIGADATRLLMLELPKTQIYIPQPVEFRMWYIRTHFNGENIRELADVLGVSQKTIYDYVKRMYSEKRPDEPRQMSLL